jgi:hypothetical protein
MDYEEIAEALGLAKGSVSLWGRDLPTPARLSYAECRKRSAEGTSSRKPGNDSRSLMPGIY